MRFPICSSENVSPQKFVGHWSNQWTDKDREADEKYYNPYIGKPLNEEGLKALFRWKNQMTLSTVKLKTVDDYIDRIGDLRNLPADTTPSSFLNNFNKGGAIWRIFLLHCWSFWRGPKYPIYDQHVHRAMTFICDEIKEEIGGWNDQGKIDAYVKRYVPFFQTFSQCDPQNVDRALMRFGQFIKNFELPLRG